MEGNELPYIGLESIESHTGRILITPEDATQIMVRGISFKFNKTNILFGKLRPYLNKVALPDFSGRCSTELVPLSPIKGYSREFLATILRSNFIVDNLMLKNKGARMPRADMKYLMSLKIIDPDINLIAKFSEYYKNIQTHFDSLINNKVKIESTFNLLLSQAFDGSLTFSWRDAHMKEVLQEMEQQKRYFKNEN